jgi:hypothetical protein
MQFPTNISIAFTWFFDRRIFKNPWIYKSQEHLFIKGNFRNESF